MTDRELLERFESGTLDPENFHHADHVRVAFLALREGQLLEVLGRFTTHLKAFAASVGKPERYHATMTCALLLLIAQRIESRGQEWQDFARKNPDLLVWPSPLLRTYYSEDVLSSDEARRTFILPQR